MMGTKKKILTLYIKKNQISNVEPSTQTKNLRYDTNKRIQILGNKYYYIKTLFERMNLKRDDLFIIGKELESEYKFSKAGIHLQNQKRRMKEALYCWYCENFFSEIYNNDPSILGKLFKISKNMKIFNEIKNKIFQFNLNNDRADEGNILPGQLNMYYNQTSHEQFDKAHNANLNNDDISQNEKQHETSNNLMYLESTKKNNTNERQRINSRDIEDRFLFPESILTEARTNEEIDVFNHSIKTPKLDNFNFEQCLKF